MFNATTLFQLLPRVGNNNSQNEYLDAVSFSATSGMALGFSFTGATIPAGGGTLFHVDYAIDSAVDYTYLSLVDLVFSDPMGIEIPYQVGSDPILFGELPDVPNPPANIAISYIFLSLKKRIS